MKLLIIKPSSMGDVVQALPVLKCLREKYPRARIDWLVNEEFSDLLFLNPYIHTIRPWDRASWRKLRRFPRALRNAASLTRKLREARYDIAFDLQGLFRSGLIGFLSGAREVVGFANAREMAHVFYHRKVEPPSDQMHEVEKHVFLVAGDWRGEREFPIVVSPQERQGAEEVLAGAGYHEGIPFVILIPGTRRPAGRWPEENFAALAEALVKKEGAQVGFVGSPSDRDLVARTASLSGCRTMDFSGKTTLKELACLLKKADVVVGGDTGPMHLAAAVGTPVVGLFGPTSPTRTSPYGRQHTTLSSGLPCSPCFGQKCNISGECMRCISVDSVYEACRQHLGKQKPKRRTA